MYLYRQERANFQANNAVNGSEETSNDHDGHGESKIESKLELFGFDSLVNILGLKRY